ncbi:hypothetical protein [Lacipirellula sp.]|uniref:hypothetical protein n=1 Tax=Lacipirellula sp. TaxID=2691419 RepID=UPI003D0C9DE8
MLLRAICVLCVLSTSVAARATDPWVDASIEVDAASSIRVLTELRDEQKAILEKTLSLKQQGRVTQLTVLECAGPYFSAESRLAWLDGDFQQSYESAQLAQLAADQAVKSTKALQQRGDYEVGEMQRNVERRAEYQLVVLRYQALAKQQEIELTEVSEDRLAQALESVDGP